MAIAYDNAAQIASWASRSSMSGSFTCSGNDRVLVVFAYCDGNVDATAVTYNSVSMTQVGTYSAIGNRRMTAWYLIAPATGSNTIAVTMSGTQYCACNAVSFTGANQSGQPHATNKYSTTDTVGTTYDTSALTTTVNTMIAMGWDNYGSTGVAGTNTTGLTTGADLATFRSSGVRSAGSNSLQVTMSSGTDKSVNYIQVAIQEVPLSTNLVSYWKFDESSGNASDSVGSNTLTNVNSTSFATGKIGNGADLELSSSNYFYKEDNSSLDITNNLSYSFWFKAETVGSGGDYRIINKWYDASEYIIRINDTSLNILVSASGGTVQVANAQTVTAGVWYHCVFTYNSTDGLKVYVNAGTPSTAAANGTINNTSERLVIGASQKSDGTGTGNYYDGLIDEVGIWSRTLTADEVSQLYNSFRGNSYPFTATPSLYGGVAYWKLDSDSTSSISTHTGTDTSVTYTTGKISNGASFNANSDSIVIPSSSEFNNASMSLSFWIKTTETGSNLNVISRYNNATNRQFRSIINNTAGKIGFIAYDSADNNTTLRNSGTINDGNWHHVVWTVGNDGSDLVTNVYTDGSLTTGPNTETGSTASLKTSGSGTIIMNGDNGIDGGMTTGMLDEVAIWSRVLTSDEVALLYNSGNGNQYPFGAIYTLLCSVGAFTLTGINAIFNRGLMMTTSVGDFTLTGIDALFKRGKGIACAVGDFTLTGIDTTITSARHLTTSVGDFTLTGIDALLYKAKILTASVGNFVLTGLPINFTGNGSWKWKNQTKNTSSWTDETKNSSSWTNENKL